ncbi:MAG: hypothetical protein FWG42_09820 [Clostridiales bacterium]|nr:hypothetical protein [Clostridiales bacterium]
MKAANKFIIKLCSVLFAFFLIALVFLAFNRSEFFFRVVFFAQLAAFALAMYAAIRFAARTPEPEVHIKVRDVTKIALLSEANELKEEFSLIDKMSALIGKNETAVCLISVDDAEVDKYAVINCVDGYWYIERVSDGRSVGLKRAGEQYVYKLKTGMHYRLHENDVIYVENERLLVI